MKANSVNAWLLRCRPSGDTSIRTSFFTNEYGIVEALYKGGRTPKKKSVLQPFMSLWLELNIRQDWHFVQKVEADSPVLPLLGHCLFAGLYVNELLYSMLKPNDPVPALFETYQKTLHGLTQVGDRLSIEPVLRRFERMLLEVSGYAISFTHEAHNGEEINEGGVYCFVAGAGFYLSKEGYSGHDLLAFSKDNLDNSETLKTIKTVMRQAIAHALDGKKIQTRKLYSSVRS